MAYAKWYAQETAGRVFAVFFAAFVFLSCFPLFLGNSRVWEAYRAGLKGGWVSAFAWQYIVSLRGLTGNRTITQMQQPVFVEGLPSCARQSLASTLSALAVAAALYCHPRRHTNVVTPSLLNPCLNLPKRIFLQFFCSLPKRIALNTFLQIPKKCICDDSRLFEIFSRTS